MTNCLTFFPPDILKKKFKEDIITQSVNKDFIDNCYFHYLLTCLFCRFVIEDAALYLSKKLNQMRTDLRKGESSSY